ncbi:MAG: NTP transferase domain-containing protein [Candidatus Eisenbacteria bacterium]|nr:NTP transferase domain-containing protein [Candidatus Eisenbacteria bacterium]
MKALVLAGGEGLRLKSVLGPLPKCLAPVQGRPFVEWQIELLREQGLGEFVLCVGVGARAVTQALGDGSRLKVAIRYSLEDAALGTAGAVRNASRFLDGRFLCVNGDTLAEFSLAEMEARHEALGARVTVLCRRVADATGKGVLAVGESGRVLRFEEKTAEGSPGLINCGYYLMETDALDRVAPGRAVSLETEVFPELLKSGVPLAAHETSGAFVDIGTPDEYLRVKEKGWR